jgi:hypothetical protein
MILPQLLSDEKYFRFFGQVRGHKILDNGEAEGVQVKPDQLIQDASAIGATEIVAPDVMGNFYGTVERVRGFAATAHEHPEFAYIGVAQGQTAKEILKCITFLSLQDWISVLALPRVMVNTLGRESRVRAIDRYHRIIEDGFEAIHCLGMGRYLQEPMLLSSRPVRGIDTSLAYTMTLGGEPLTPTSTIYYPRPRDYFQLEPSNFNFALLNANLETFANWAAKEPVDRSVVQDI